VIVQQVFELSKLTHQLCWGNLEFVILEQVTLHTFSVREILSVDSFLVLLMPWAPEVGSE